MKSVKHENRPLIWAFAVLNAGLFWYLLSAGALDSFSLAGLRSFVEKSSILSGISLVVALVLDSLLARPIKEVMVHLRLRYATPGHEAFSRYANTDARIDSDRLRSRNGELPSEPLQQNRLWYRIYRTQQNEPAVTSALKDYLLARDLAVVSAIFCVLGSAIIAWFSGWQSALGSFFGVTVGEYILFSHIARVHSVALVQNVLAIDSAK